MPSVTVPSVSVPCVSMPCVNVPCVNVPCVAVPSVTVLIADVSAFKVVCEKPLKDLGSIDDKPVGEDLIVDPPVEN